MGLAVVFVIVLAALVSWPIYHYILVPAGLSFLDTIVYILVIASLVQLVGLVIKKYSPSLYKNLGIYLPLITTNCAVLGVVQENNAYTFGNSMANASHFPWKHGKHFLVMSCQIHAVVHDCLVLHRVITHTKS